MKPLVFLCSMPASGNRAVCQALQDCGAEPWIVHGVPSGDEGRHRRRGEGAIEARYRPGESYGIMLVRSWPMRRRSVENQPSFYGWHEEYPEEDRYARMAAELVRLGIPWRAMSYEGFVDEPLRHMDILREWIPCLGPGQHLDWVRNGNERWRAEA